MCRPIYVLMLCLAIAFGSVGCGLKKQSIPKDWVAIGGSRADATVKLGYNYYPQNEIPVLSQEQGLELARKKCQSWGYDNAEAFGSAFERCTSGSYDGAWGTICYSMEVTKEYQCIGKLPPAIEDISSTSAKNYRKIK